MKKSFSLALLYIWSIMLYVATAQETNPFNKFSIEPEIGLTKIRDITSVQQFNADLGARYMFNELFGVKVSGNYTNIDNYEYKSGSLMGVINMGRLLKFETFTKNVTILGGVGGNLSDSENPTNDVLLFRKTNFHLAAFTDLEFKLSNRVFLRTGMDVVTGVNLERNVPDPISETTTILNFNVGITIAFGKHKEHADWYLRESKIDTVKLQPVIIDNTITNNITKEVSVESDCNCSIQRYLYFAHDSYLLTQDTQEAIEYSKDEVLKGKKVILKAYCSNLGSIEYNKKLANNRALAVKDALIGLGVSADDIIIEPVGIDLSRDKEVFAFGRRVELKVE